MVILSRRHLAGVRHTYPKGPAWIKSLLVTGLWARIRAASSTAGVVAQAAMSSDTRAQSPTVAAAVMAALIASSASSTSAAALRIAFA